MSSRVRPCFHALFKNPMMATIFAKQHKCQLLLPTREGRVQAERPTRTRPQGQGNGPEGERHTQLDRSPCPGRRCPCGCPQQVGRLGHPLARGVARMAPGWLPTIMADPVQPCPQTDDTHQEYPRDMDPPAGDTSVVCGSCGRSCCAGLDPCHLRWSDVMAGHATRMAHLHSGAELNWIR